MWWSTPCFGVAFENVGHVIAGRSSISRSKSWAAKEHLTTEMVGTLSDTANASVVSKVSALMSRRRRTSTRRPWWHRKSAPKIGCETSATLNFQQNVFVPSFSDFVRSPKDAMSVLLAARNGGPMVRNFRSLSVGGSRLISAPVSTK